MKVKHICYYLTDWNGITPRQQDYDTAKVVHCLKGRTVKGFFDVVLRGTSYRVEDKNKSEFLAALWVAIGSSLATSLNEQHALVPIPNSSALVGDATDYRTLTYAKDIAASSSGKVIAIDALRWKKGAGEIHKIAGLRTPDPRYENLAVISAPTQPVILFDDVITSGSSFIAACWRLGDHKITPAFGFVVARRTVVQEEKMFVNEDRDLLIPTKPFHLAAD